MTDKHLIILVLSPVHQDQWTKISPSSAPARHTLNQVCTKPLPADFTEIKQTNQDHWVFQSVSGQHLPVCTQYPCQCQNKSAPVNISAIVKPNQHLPVLLPVKPNQYLSVPVPVSNQTSSHQYLYQYFIKPGPNSISTIVKPNQDHSVRHQSQYWYDQYGGLAPVTACPTVMESKPGSVHISPCVTHKVMSVHVSCCHTHTRPCQPMLQWYTPNITCTQDCHVGLVVKASTSKTEDLGFESRLSRDFLRLSHTSDLKIVTPVATLPSLAL